MYVTSTKVLLRLCALSILFLGGCGLQGEPPVVSISDPAVYTSLHLYAAKKYVKDGSVAEKRMKEEYAVLEYAQRKDEPNAVSFSVLDDMERYFRKTEEWYKKNHFRMDAMLDDSQRISDALHVYESMARLALRYSPLGLQAATEPLASGLIPSSLFAGSPDTREKLQAAEKARKTVEEKKIKLKKAEADLAKAKKTLAKASASMELLTERYDKKEKEVRELNTQKEKGEDELSHIEDRLNDLEERLKEIRGAESKTDPNSRGKAERLQIEIENLREEIRKKKSDNLGISNRWRDAELRVEDAHKELEREKNEDKLGKAKKDVENAEANLNKAKGALSGAETEAKDEQGKAREALANEVEHPLAALRPKLVGLVSDSPFDRIDRAYDFYTAYMLKCLRSFGDSRAIQPYLKAMDPNELKHWFGEFETVDVNDPNLPRVLLVAFQVHVHPGTRPNYMAGLRLRVTKAKRKHSSGKDINNVNDVRIMQLHPTRAYDIEDQLLLERINTAFGLSLSGSLPEAKASAALAWEERKKSEERRNFLSRISKTASFHDAGRHEFGWNFYPSNLTVERKGPGQSFNELLKSGPTGDYVVNAYLEGGARDCSVYMLVPYDVTEITLNVQYVIKSVAHGEFNLPERRYQIDNKGGMRNRIKWLKEPSLIQKLGKPFCCLFMSKQDLDLIGIDEGDDNCVRIRLPDADDPTIRTFEVAAASFVLPKLPKRSK